MFNLERSEEELLAKRRSYLRRRVNRVVNLFTDQKRKNSIELLVEHLEAHSLTDLKHLIIAGTLPGVPDDKGQTKSVSAASEFSGLDPATICGIAKVMVDEQEKEIQQIKDRVRYRRSLLIAIAALLVSLVTAGSNVYSKFIQENNAVVPDAPPQGANSDGTAPKTVNAATFPAIQPLNYWRR